jgi:hypothetical protein
VQRADIQVAEILLAHLRDCVEQYSFLRLGRPYLRELASFSNCLAEDLTKQWRSLFSLRLPRWNQQESTVSGLPEARCYSSKPPNASKVEEIKESELINGVISRTILQFLRGESVAQIFVLVRRCFPKILRKRCYDSQQRRPTLADRFLYKRKAVASP